MADKHLTIPVFIPHAGCPNVCVFCDQRSITGAAARLPTPGEVRDFLDKSLSGGKPAEIAFFGGSFTGIGRDLMRGYLAAARDFVETGRASGIRCSTRPDYISRETLDILEEYGVGTVELGIQSMDDRVLAISRRGHTSADTIRAAGLIREYGIALVGQMMVGLPGASPQSETDCAGGICAAGAVAARVYPTVVFSGTELHAMALRGEYTPLDDTVAAIRTAAVLRVFAAGGVRCIRAGLYSPATASASASASAPSASAPSSAGGKVWGGASHEAAGELAIGEIYYENIRAALEEISGKLTPRGDDYPRRGNAVSIKIAVGRGRISCAVGHGRRNKTRIWDEYSKKFNIKSMKFIEIYDIIDYGAKIILED